MSWTAEQVLLMSRLRKTGITEEKCVQLYRELGAERGEDSCSSLGDDMLTNLDDNFLGHGIGKSSNEVNNITNISQQLPPFKDYTILDCSMLKNESERHVQEFHQCITRMTKSVEQLVSSERSLSDKLAAVEREKADLSWSYESEKSHLSQELTKALDLIKSNQETLKLMTNENSSLQRKCSNLETERNSIQEELRLKIDDLHSQLTLLRSELKDSYRKKQEIIDERNSLSSQLKCLQEEKTTLGRKLDLCEEKLQTCNKKLEEERQKLAEFRTKLETLEDEKDTVESESNLFKRRLDLLQSELDLSRKSQQEIQLKLLSEEKERERLVEENEQLKMTLAEVEKSRKELKKDASILKMNKTQIEQELLEKRTEIEELNSKIEEKFEKDSKKLQEWNRDREKLAALEISLKAEKVSSKKKEEEIKRLESVRASLEAKLNRCNDELLTFNQSIVDLEKKMLQDEAKLNEFENEKKEIEEHLIKLNSILKSCLKLGSISSRSQDDDSGSKSRKSISSIFSDTELLDLDYVRTSIIDLITKAECITKERDQAQTYLETSEKTYQQMKLTHKNLKQRLEKLEESVEEYEKERKNLQRKIDELSGNTAKLETTIEKLKQEKASLQSKLEQNEKNLDKTDKERRKLLAELSTVKSTRVMIEKDLSERDKNRDLIEMKLKKSEAAEEMLESQISTMSKRIEQLERERDKLDKEVNSLEMHNYKLHVTLDETNSMLKKCAESDKDARILAQKVRQLEAELNLANIKRKEVEEQMSAITDANIEKDMKIVQFRDEIDQLETAKKMLTLNNKALERTWTLSAPKNGTKVLAKEPKIEINEKKIFTDEAGSGLKALEEENVKLKNRVKSLSNMIDEAENIKATNTEITKLTEAQKLAEELLQLREERIRSSTVTKGPIPVKSRGPELSVTEITSTPMKFKSLSGLTNGRIQVTSTPLPAGVNGSGGDKVRLMGRKSTSSSRQSLGNKAI